MSCCDGCDNMATEDVEVKQEPVESDTVKCEDFPSEFESENPDCDSKDLQDSVAADLQTVIQPGIQ